MGLGSILTIQTRESTFASEALPHRNDLYRTAARLLADRTRAADAVQETYLVAWKRFAQYEPGTNCKAWLFQILFNVARHQRRQWLHWVIGKKEDPAEIQLAAPVPIPGHISDTQILAAIDSLPQEFRSVLLLIDIEEFSYKEASRTLHLPIGTVMSRLSRARTRLRHQLAPVAKAYGITRDRATFE